LTWVDLVHCKEYNQEKEKTKGNLKDLLSQQLDRGVLTV